MLIVTGVHLQLMLFVEKNSLNNAMKTTDNKQLKTFENLFDAKLEEAIFEQEPALDWLKKNIIIDQSILKLTKKQLIKLANKLYVVILTEREVYENDRNTFFDVTEKSIMSNDLLRNSNQTVRAFAKTRADDLIRVDRSKKAKASRQIGLDNSIKQDELKIVKACWDEWQKKPSNYKDNTKFATDMLKKFEQDDTREQIKHLNSIKVITAHCTKWKRESGS